MGSEMNQLESPDNPTILLRRLHRWRMASFGLIILVAGMVSGAAVTTLTIGSRDRWQGQGLPKGPIEPVVTKMLEDVTVPLHLSPEQVEQVRPIFQDHITRLHEIFADGRTQIMNELKNLNEKLAPVLDDEQKDLWEKYLQNLPGPFQRGGGPMHRRGGQGPDDGHGRGGRGFERWHPPGEPNAGPGVPYEGPSRVD